MIISNKHKFVFIHNPKCAGHSIRKALGEYHDSEIKYWDHEYNPVLDRIIDKAHLWAKDIPVYEPLDFDQFFVFGFVRNPYERFKSAFNQYRFMNPEHESLDINDFSESVIDEFSIRYDWNLIHFCPQYLFFYHGHKRIADFIGKQEKFAEGLTFISSVVGFHIEHILTNKSPFEGDSEPELSPGTIKIINKLYERDFILFDYPMIPAEDDDVEEQLLTYRERISRVYPSIANTVISLDANYRQLKADNAFSLQRLKELESELEQTRSGLREAQSRFESARSEVEETRTKLEDARTEYREALSQIQTMQAELQDTTAQLQEAQAALLAVQCELRGLYGSRSWRYMRPARAFFSIFK